MTGLTAPGLAAVAGTAAVALAGASALTVRLLSRRLYLITVDGRSMAPTLMPGDRLLVVRPLPRPRPRSHTRRRARPPARTGDIVIAPAPRAVGWAGQPALRPAADRADWVVKRVAATAGDRVPDRLRSSSGLRDRDTVPEGTVLLLGDGKHSEDSRHWGFCPDHLVLGRVLLRISRGPGAGSNDRTPFRRPPDPRLPEPVPAPGTTDAERR
ncbi:S26 family signal peptidase [Streptomyces sp. NPDC052299]|uniref:S26 family signal peptidase n=1 Tax=Streptomyces sp. NPDC052299 TaxID=3155054 RepID=UPI0034255EB1